MAVTVGAVHTHTHTQAKLTSKLNKEITYPFWRGLFANVKFVANHIRDG